MTETTVLIAESDSRWSEWARASRKPQHQLILIVQHGQESQRDFFCRVKERLEGLLRHAGRLSRVVLIGGTHWDGPALSARAEMLRGILLRSARRAFPPQLLLDAGATHGPSLRGMRAIAEALNQGTMGGAAHPRLVVGPMSANPQAA